MSQSETTLTLADGITYEVAYESSLVKGEPETRDYPGSPAYAVAEVTSVHRYITDDETGAEKLISLPYKAFPNVWDELEEQLNEEKDGHDLLQELADNMEDFSNLVDHNDNR